MNYLLPRVSRQKLLKRKSAEKKVGAILTLLLFTFHFCSEDIFENNSTLNEPTKFLGRWWYYRTRRSVKGDVKIGSNSVAVYTLELYVTEGERNCTTGIYECLPPFLRSLHTIKTTTMCVWGFWRRWVACGDYSTNYCSSVTNEHGEKLHHRTMATYSKGVYIPISKYIEGTTYSSAQEGAKKGSAHFHTFTSGGRHTAAQAVNELNR